jgi:hypothetical protein
MPTRHEGTNRKIIQVIPATGWYARFIDSADAPPDEYVPLVFWALVEDEQGQRWVEGLECTFDGVLFAEDVSNFLEYVSQAEMNSETWYAKYLELRDKLDAASETDALESAARTLLIDALLDKMKEADADLFRRLMETPGFSYHFKQAIEVAKGEDPLPES